MPTSLSIHYIPSWAQSKFSRAFLFFITLIYLLYNKAKAFLTTPEQPNITFGSLAFFFKLKILPIEKFPDSLIFITRHHIQSTHALL